MLREKKKKRKNLLLVFVLADNGKIDLAFRGSACISLLRLSEGYCARVSFLLCVPRWTTQMPPIALSYSHVRQIAELLFGFRDVHVPVTGPRDDKLPLCQYESWDSSLHSLHQMGLIKLLANEWGLMAPLGILLCLNKQLKINSFLNYSFYHVFFWHIH